MDSQEIRIRFLDFFRKRSHFILDSAPLLTTDEKSVTDSTLFNTAGVQPLIPFILKGEHPFGQRLASAQKCIRTVDLEEVGDSTHLTFFEMLGNWSIGDYFKKEAINFSLEFLTSKTEGLGLDINSLYVTVFEGNENAPIDNESFLIWKEIFERNGLDPLRRIFFLPEKNNWWSAGDNGPCGPDTEMFYDVSGKHKNGLTKEEYLEADDKREVVEIWNDVFMEFEKKDGKIIGKLPVQVVDTGSGLERLAMVIQKKDNVYDIDGFFDILQFIRKETGESFNIVSARIILDHLRSAMFMISEGLEPSNTDRGYILRRIIRRAVWNSDKINFSFNKIDFIGSFFQKKYGSFYGEIFSEKIKNIIQEEENKFRKTLSSGLKEFEKGTTDPFLLFTTYGFPLDLTRELAKDKGILINEDDFFIKMKEHQELSRAGAEQKFKGGLSNHNEKTIKLHTAHHLLLAALQNVLGQDVHQRGSNITEDRLRIDFNFQRKLTEEEKTKIENWVNDKIDLNLNVVRKEMPFDEAKKLGAEMEFGTKYPEMVSVYFIEDSMGNIYSKEFCGGPHVSKTADIGRLKIQKEEASSQGVRRIKAVII